MGELELLAEGIRDARHTLDEGDVAAAAHEFLHVYEPVMVELLAVARAARGYRDSRPSLAEAEVKLLGALSALESRLAELP
jgi:hypothetical protein